MTNSDGLPFFSALLITYRRPKLLQNALALWYMQDYPMEHRELLILDDAPNFDAQQKDNWQLFSTDKRFPNLHAKYNWLLERVNEKCKIVAQFDDDDIPFPGYITAHATALRTLPFGYSKPSHVLSNYMFPDSTGRVMEEGGGGRFPSSQAWRIELLRQVGGFIMGHDVAADQHLISRSHQLASQTVSPWKPWGEGGTPQYVFRWHGTGYKHSSSHTGEDWYSKQSQTTPEQPFIGKLTPQLDETTKQILSFMKVLY